MAANYNEKPLLEVEGLRQYFPVSKTFTVKAVNDVSFKVYPGETYGLVGESGSGKSTIGRSIIRLYDPTSGKVTFDGDVISGKLSKSTKDKLRVQMQMIFQDPMASLNPRKKIKDIIGEGLDMGKEFMAEFCGKADGGARGKILGGDRRGQAQQRHQHQQQNASPDHRV